MFLVAQRIKNKLNTIKNKPGSSTLCTLIPFLFSFSKRCVPQWIVSIQGHMAWINAAHRVYHLMSVSASVQSSAGWQPQIPSAGLQKGVRITLLGSPLDFIVINHNATTVWLCYIHYLSGSKDSQYDQYNFCYFTLFIFMSSGVQTGSSYILTVSEYLLNKWEKRSVFKQQKKIIQAICWPIFMIIFP